MKKILLILLIFSCSTSNFKDRSVASPSLDGSNQSKPLDCFRIKNSVVSWYDYEKCGSNVVIPEGVITIDKNAFKRNRL